ncbi:MAG: hypothetical protein K8R67_12620 [Desulfobacteraceae bacterium]|nr:hypothetical protein [Desulfobacteraceae bacterium]
MQLRWLFAHPYTTIYEDYDGVEKSLKLGPFNCGFNVQVDDRQKQLNMEAAKIINEKCISKETKLEGYKNLAKGLIYK